MTRFLQSLGHQFRHRDELVPADAIVVPDGGEFDNRFASGLSLFRRGYAPRLIVCRSSYHEGESQWPEKEARLRPNDILLLRSRAVSTQDEAQEAGPLLKRLGCRSVLVVTSWYHTRRARTIFARELMRDGIEVRTFPVDVPDSDAETWWESKEGRTTVLLESVKLLLTWLHVRLPVAPDFRFRVKQWLQPTAFRPWTGLALVSEGPSEILTSSFQNYLRISELRRGEMSAFGFADREGLTSRAGPGSPSVLRWPKPDFARNGADDMEGKSFKAVTITAKESGGHTALVEAFNAWAEKERPSLIVHVHYYHDDRSRRRGYQIIFEESERAEARLEPKGEERRAA
jgi:uncharacterized SAM-binding protein YcdF (DUF218 family)